MKNVIRLLWLNRKFKREGIEGDWFDFEVRVKPPLSWREIIAVLLLELSTKVGTSRSPGS